MVKQRHWCYKCITKILIYSCGWSPVSSSSWHLEGYPATKILHQLTHRQSVSEVGTAQSAPTSFRQNRMTVHSAEVQERNCESVMPGVTWDLFDERGCYVLQRSRHWSSFSPIVSWYHQWLTQVLVEITNVACHCHWATADSCYWVFCMQNCWCVPYLAYSSYEVFHACAWCSHQWQKYKGTSRQFIHQWQFAGVKC